MNRPTPAPDPGRSRSGQSTPAQGDLNSSGVKTPSTETIDRERHSRIARWFEELYDLEGPERRERLEQMRKEDRIGVRMLQELLALDVEGSSPLDLPHSDEPLRMPDRIGEFRIVEELGSGGMAVVWLAEQDTPRRQVALKVLRHAQWSAGGLARFEREAAALGRLNHPGIAQVHRGGTQRQGSDCFAFLAMELIEGQRFTAWASKASLEERLNLLARVSDAVHYAHGQGVIHRDLKPSNVMVSSGGDPKILDFGVARLRPTEGDEQGDTMTRLGEVVGTLQYMAPEQARATGEEIDERADVYSLGVLTYEVLGGRLPYEVSDLPVHLAAERIETQEPVRLGRVDSSLVGDLETIVGKALEKDPARRYATARAFGDDLRRYLANVPIQARRASAWYRTRKFIARNRLTVSLGSAVFLLLVTAVAGMSWKAREAQGLARISNQRLERAREVTRLLTEMFDSIDPELEGPDARVADMMVRAEQSLTGSDRSPLVHAALHHSLGQAWSRLGDNDVAVRHLRRAVELNREAGAESWELAQSLGALGSHLLEEGGAPPVEIRGYLEGAVKEATEALGADDPVTIDYAVRLAYFEWEFGEREGVLDRLRELVVALERTSDPGEWRGSHARQRLAAALTMAGEYEEAERWIREAVEVTSEKYGERHVRTALQRNVYSDLLREQGRFEESLEQAELALEIYENADLVDGPRVGATLTQTAGACLAMGRHEQGLAYLERAQELVGKPEERLSRSSITVSLLLGTALLDLGDVDRAGPVLEVLGEVATEENGATLETRARTLDGLGILASWRGDLEGAYEFQREANELRDSDPGTTLPDLAGALFNEGTLLRRLKRYEESIGPLRRSLELETELRGIEHPYTAQAGFELALTLSHLDRHDAAAEYLENSLRGFGASLGDRSPEAGTVLMMQGIIEVERGNPERAIEFLERRRQLPMSDAERCHLDSWVGHAEVDLGLPEQAWERLEPQVEWLRESGRWSESQKLATDLGVSASLALRDMGRFEEGQALAAEVGLDLPAAP